MGERDGTGSDLTFDGFQYRPVTPLGEASGSGQLVGPDGSWAGIQWEVGHSPYIMRLEGPAADHWGVYRVGFTRPVLSPADLRANLQPLIPKFRVIYTRLRVH